jgi:hypothetical protein
MKVFQITTDASDIYSPNSAAGSNGYNEAAVAGNLSDVIRNSTIFRVTHIAPNFVLNHDLKPTSASPTVCKTDVD